MRLGHRFIDYLGGEAEMLSLPELLDQFFEYLVKKDYVKETDKLALSVIVPKLNDIFESNKTTNAGTGYNKEEIIKAIASYLDNL